MIIFYQSQSHTLTVFEVHCQRWVRGHYVHELRLDALCVAKLNMCSRK